ncbi:MAG: Methylthioribose-1-phosphate isomerase [Firmicutes bacterium ADurb.Bin506]|nr:MAG: Methylthioribose-1-phosphate isomerase [Firmicutes bacterium ADurb.Bin506]
MLVPIGWDREAGAVRIIDQTLLPCELRHVHITSMNQMCEAIARLKVRGAPAIGVAGAFGAYLGMKERASSATSCDGDFVVALSEVCDTVASVRPTAVNLAWAVARVRRAAERVMSVTSDTAAAIDAMLTEALSIMEEDRRSCELIGINGASLIPDGARVLTHCNAGALATAGMGTALAPIYVRHSQGAKVKVWADETRPLLQGARLTAFELSQAGIDVTVICDGMAASLMAAGEVDLVIVGADRVAANGDVCNKIGTYGLACAAWVHGIPLYVACPTSTIDLSLASGDQIPIEQRSSDEIANGFGCRTVPEGVAVHNPAFDVTPARMVAAIITERGVARPPFQQGIASIAGA